MTARKNFLAIYERGQRVSTPFFVLFAVPGATSRSRLGITATKKFGNAAARNRIKRVVRELFRHHRDDDAPIDLVVNVKSAAAGREYRRLEADFARHVAQLSAKVRS